MPTNTTPRNEGTLAHLRGLIPNRAVTSGENKRIAETQAAGLRTLLGATEPEFPIEAIASLPKTVVIYDTDLPTSGMTYWNGSSWVITLNAHESPARQRFSLVHEYKHIVDHNAAHALYGADNVLPERTADYFAACVLMPKMLVKRHWGRGPRHLQAMADLFGVSREAMKFRLDQLGLTESRSRCYRGTHQSTKLQEIAA